jgi:hypothetical protein
MDETTQLPNAAQRIQQETAFWAFLLYRMAQAFLARTARPE